MFFNRKRTQKKKIQVYSAAKDMFDQESVDKNYWISGSRIMNFIEIILKIIKFQEIKWFKSAFYQVHSSFYRI